MTWFRRRWHRFWFWAMVVCAWVNLLDFAVGTRSWDSLFWCLFNLGAAYLQVLADERFCKPERSCGFCLPEVKEPSNLG